MVESRLVVCQPFQHCSKHIRIMKKWKQMYDVIETVIENRDTSHDDRWLCWKIRGQKCDVDFGAAVKSVPICNVSQDKESRSLLVSRKRCCVERSPLPVTAFRSSPNPNFYAFDDPPLSDQPLAQLCMPNCNEVELHCPWQPSNWIANSLAVLT